MSAEKFGAVLLKSFLKEDLVKNFRSLVVSLRIVPTYHEIMSISAVSYRCLIHDCEVVTIFEDFFASFLSLNADDGSIVKWPAKVIFLEHFVAFQYTLGNLRCVEGQEGVGRGASEGTRETIEQEFRKHASI